MPLARRRATLERQLRGAGGERLEQVVPAGLDVQGDGGACAEGFGLALRVHNHDMQALDLVLVLLDNALVLLNRLLVLLLDVVDCVAQTLDMALCVKHKGVESRRKHHGRHADLLDVVVH